MSYFLIQLKSDLCVSNGESFGSSIDTDISYDTFGLPIIKAKSLKGCLREVSEELEDINAIPQGFTDRIFGIPGQSLPSSLSIQNAHPTNYEELINDVCQNHISQDVLKNVYTYTRTQTSIDKVTGTAKKETLRSIRVLRRGLVFICEYFVPEKDNEDFKKCIQALRYIGMNRTRGLGNIRCTPICFDPNDSPDDEPNADGSFFENDYLEYKIHALSPVISNINNNSDYIPAAAIIGLCFNAMGQNEMLSILDNDTIFTNAYISNGEKQFFKNPAFFAKQKEADYNENGIQIFVFDTESCSKVDPPALALKSTNMYVSYDLGTILSFPVYREINYHHKQSQENPGIVDGINFYQLTSFSENQTFIGKIYGTPENLSKIYNCLTSKSYHNIGYYRNSGYGRCCITLSKKKQNQEFEHLTDSIAICLCSPAIIYDEMGMPCTKPQIFASYVDAAISSKFGFGIAKDQDNCYIIEESYQNYTNLSGFNSTWGMNKPVIRAYGEGTSFVFRLEKEVDISKIIELFIGERNTEGYGEAIVFNYNRIIEIASKPIFLKKTQVVCSVSAHNDYTDQHWKLPSVYIDQQNKIRTAVEAAQENCAVLMSAYSLNPSTIGRLSLMLKESVNYEHFKKSVNEIKDKKKLNKILKWISLDYNGKHTETEYYREYLNTLFTHAKYAQRRSQDEQ